MEITSHPNKSRSHIGVNRDGQAVGYAARVRGRNGRPTTYTAFVYIADPPFDVARTGFTSEASVVEFIGKNGTPDARIKYAKNAIARPATP